MLFKYRLINKQFQQYDLSIKTKVAPLSVGLNYLAFCKVLRHCKIHFYDKNIFPL